MYHSCATPILYGKEVNCQVYTSSLHTVNLGECLTQVTQSCLLYPLISCCFTILKMLNSCLVKLILIKLFTSISHLKMNGLWGNKMRIPYMAIVLRTQSPAREWLSWKRHLLSNVTAWDWTSVPMLWNKRTKFSNQSLDFQMHAGMCTTTQTNIHTPNKWAKCNKISFCL